MNALLEKPLSVVAMVLLCQAALTRGAASAAATAPCALHVQTVVAVDEKVYAVILRSDEVLSDVNLALYSEGNDYAVSLPGLRFEPTASPEPPSRLAPAAGFASAPIFVVLPKVDVIIAARAEFSDGSLQRDKDCFADYAYTDFYQKLSNPTYTRSEEDKTLKLELSHAYVRGAPTVTALATIARTATGGKGCPVGASMARMTRVMEPDYPAAARAGGITGSVQVFVRLDQDGKLLETGIYKSSGSPTLDQAARRAAETSSYSPEIFRCERIPGTYLFRANFTRSR